MKRYLYGILLLVSLLITIAGLLTLLPIAGASYPNVLGYKSLCTFAPAATLYCLLIAGSVCFLRSAFVKDRSGNLKKKLKKHARSFIPLALVLALAVGATVWFVNVKSQYTETVSAATGEIAE